MKDTIAFAIAQQREDGYAAMHDSHVLHAFYYKLIGLTFVLNRLTTLGQFKRPSSTTIRFGCSQRCN